MNVTLFRDFEQDHRTSMEVYADGVAQALRCVSQSRHAIRDFRPIPPHWLRAARNTSPLRMRVARFVTYPFQARKHQGDINHILDQGYGHLLYALNPARTVVTVHDVIPLLRWRGRVPGIPRGRKPWLNMLSFDALKRAAHIVADSETTRRDVIEICGVSGEKTTVVPLAVDDAFRPFSPEQKAVAGPAVGLPSGDARRVLVVGCISYKNNFGALRAFARLARLHQGALQLIVVGSPDRAWLDRVDDTGLRGSTVVLRDIPREKMPALYNAVDCLLFPSLYEGFGWPPLEAMACGLPVVTSNVASLPDVVGDAALMVQPDDDVGLAHAMALILNNEEYRRELTDRGLRRARRFTWEQTGRQTLDVYERVLRRLGKT